MESPANAREGETFPEMLLRPVGVVRNGIKEPSLAVGPGGLERRGNPEKATDKQSGLSDLVIADEFVGALDGIEDFSHLLVLYWAHRVPPEGRLLTRVHPRGREDLPLVGIFSGRSPARPNLVCLTPVRLLERRANVLKVEGLDALDGSPLIDIKPHTPRSFAPDDLKVPDWWNK